jgi:hypothetical protein
VDEPSIVVPEPWEWLWTPTFLDRPPVTDRRHGIRVTVTPGRLSAATRGWASVRTARLTKACPGWSEEARRVAAVLRGAWRASSLVECVNSVARMQQARHRRMTPGLLDLKRLYWDPRRFRVGRRKDQTPYGLLGLDLPELSFWESLKLTPEELREKLSAKEDAT